MQLTNDQRAQIEQAICSLEHAGFKHEPADLRALLAAHSAGAQEPVAWRHSKTLCLYETEDAVPLADGDEWAEPLYAHPQPMADVARDVEFEITPEIASEWARRQDIERVLKDFSTQRCAIEDARTLHLAEIERLDREGE